MAQIRHISISNFRCIEQLNWFPGAGINCLIGPGDAGKSSILDAIDLCLGARRTVQFTDADFHGLNVATPIVIRITIGDLSDALKSMETYGAYVRGYNAATQTIDDEPEAGKETVLTVQLTVGSDLDPVWTLVSDRAQAQGLSRNLTWGDRTRLSPTRIGALAESNLAWRRGSVLNRLTEEKADTSAALASAARDARKAFGNLADAQLGETLKIVADTARELGIPAGDTLKASLTPIQCRSVAAPSPFTAMMAYRSVRLASGRRACWSPASSATRKARLTILFVCSGGRIDPHPETGMAIGLAKQILARGSAAVIGPAWPIPFFVARPWLDAFLKAWQGGMVVLDACHVANRHVSNKTSWDPKRALAMSLYGDPFIRKDA